MDENFTRGYVQLHLDSPGFEHLPHFDRRQKAERFPFGQEPRDRCSCIYMALILCGAGFLLPYNSFITAVDYYQNKFPGTTIIFDMSLTYICMALLAVIINNFLVNLLSLHTRVTFGYVVSFLTLLFVGLCDIWFAVFSKQVSYRVTLAAVAVVALGCTVQQSSFYGFTSMLPSRYTQAVMTGESAAGVIVSLNRIISKGLLPNSSQSNTIIFFVVSMGTLMLCCILFHVTRNSDFVKHHVSGCKLAGLAEGNTGQQATNSQSMTEEVDILDGHASRQYDGYGVLALRTSPNSPPPANYHRFDNPSFTLDSDGEATESNTQQRSAKVEIFSKPSSSASAITKIKNGFKSRLRVAKLVWPYMVSIGLAYFVTLCLFPGIETEVVSCTLGSWMPVILISIFNLFDFLGKILASIHHDWHKGKLVLLTCARLLLVPLLMMCAAPRSKPIFQEEAWSMIFSLFLGLTNGYFGSVPMILAPTKVADSQKELTGNTMTLSYSFGLTSGSIIAYLLDLWLGPHLDYDPCSTMFTSVFSSTESYNTTATHAWYNSTGSFLTASTAAH